MPPVTSNQRNFLNIYFPRFLWGFWILFLVLVCYLTRYWINHDVIGSLDSARYFRHLQFKEAFNAYWGVGYALLLTLLPLNNATSWLQAHLLVGLLILISQLFIYRALLALNVRNYLATILCIIWGATNFSTGAGLFITSDIPLVFFASIFLFVAIKSDLAGTLTHPGPAALLGTLHGLAWITKTVALPGLILFPGLVFLRGLFAERDFVALQAKLLRGLKFIAAYSLPLLIMVGLWAAGSYSKYGRVTLSESSTYNYALYINKSDQLHKAKDEARHELPKYGTYFWSDIGASFTDWDHKILFNFNNQINRALYTINYFFVSENIRDGCVILLLFVLSILGCFFLRGQTKEYLLLGILSVVGWFIIFIYSSVNLVSRYLPFAVIFLLPVCAVFLDQLLQKQKNFLKISVFAILLFGLAHGLASMTYTAIFLAPGGEDFAIAKFLKTQNTSQKSLGPLGAYLGRYDYVHHHAVIGYLLKVQAAEIKPIGTAGSHFTASFSPNTVLLGTSPREPAPAMILVNQREYKKIYSCVWGRSYKKTQLTIYR
jgi:hypothetical protein